MTSDILWNDSVGTTVLHLVVFHQLWNLLVLAVAQKPQSALPQKPHFALQQLPLLLTAGSDIRTNSTHRYPPTGSRSSFLPSFLGSGFRPRGYDASIDDGSGRHRRQTTPTASVVAATTQENANKNCKLALIIPLCVSRRVRCQDVPGSTWTPFVVASNSWVTSLGLVERAASSKMACLDYIKRQFYA